MRFFALLAVLVTGCVTIGDQKQFDLADMYVRQKRFAEAENVIKGIKSNPLYFTSERQRWNNETRNKQVTKEEVIGVIRKISELLEDPKCNEGDEGKRAQCFVDTIDARITFLKTFNHPFNWSVTQAVNEKFSTKLNKCTAIAASYKAEQKKKATQEAVDKAKKALEERIALLESAKQGGATHVMTVATGLVQVNDSFHNRYECQEQLNTSWICDWALACKIDAYIGALKDSPQIKVVELSNKDASAGTRLCENLNTRILRYFSLKPKHKTIEKEISLESFVAVKRDDDIEIKDERGNAREAASWVAISDFLVYDLTPFPPEN